jgi:hypothetical protein
VTIANRVDTADARGVFMEAFLNRLPAPTKAIFGLPGIAVTESQAYLGLEEPSAVTSQVFGASSQ